MKPFRRFLLLAPLLLAACATPPQPAPGLELPQADLPGLSDCRERFREIDAQVAEAGVAHAGYHRIPGFPYLRTDRVLASFARDVQSDAAIGTWVRRMRAHDAEAREYELHNLGLENPERRNLHTDLYRCGRGLAFLDLQIPGNLAHLRAEAARIARGRDPSTMQRLAETLSVPLDALRGALLRARTSEEFA